MILLFFFFFKQKTAYEMRISDWSSDVCSSDLDQSGENLFDKNIVLQHQFFARLRAKGLKQIAILFGKIRPFERHGDRFHIGNPLYTLAVAAGPVEARSEEHTSELQSLMRISYAVFCLKKKKQSDKD